MRATSLALLACVLAVRAAEVPAAADPLAPAPEASAAVTGPGGAYGAAFATPTAQAQALPPTLFNRLSKIAKVTLLGGAPDSTERDLIDRGAGIERLTDANWADMVVNGSPEDTWLVIIDGQDPMSPMYVEGHRNASRLAKEALQAAKHSTKLDEEIERLKHIRWGRLDYASEPNLCTRWWIWRPPYLLWATDNGKTLRFLKPSQVRPDGDNLHKIMTSGQWDQIPVWNSTYGPDGDRAWLAEHYITASNFVGSKTSGIPNFMWMLLSGAISQSLLQWFHKKDKRAAAKDSTQPAQKRKIDTGKLLERVREQMALRDQIQAEEKARLEKEGKAAQGKAAPAKQPTPVAPAGGKGKASGSRSTGGTPVNRKKRAD